MSEEFVIYAGPGGVAISVCTSLPREAIEDRANEESPTGIRSPWAIRSPTFLNGEPNPCPCEQRPETHQHWLLNC